MPGMVSSASDISGVRWRCWMPVCLSPALLCLACDDRLRPADFFQQPCLGCGKWKKRNTMDGHKLCVTCRKDAIPSCPLPAAPVQKMRGKRKTYDECGPTWRRIRREKGRQALEEIGVPPQALMNSRVKPTSLVHLSTATRREIRTVGELQIAGEKRMADCKELLAATHGTGTSKSCDEDGLCAAWITDPLLFVRTVASQSRVLAVGGDHGGDYTKIGITFTSPNKQQAFTPLLVYSAKDTWEQLNHFRGSGITPFVGESAGFTDIWAVLQHLIDTRLVMLNGDWPFVCAVLGHLGASATFPCPICIVGNQGLLKVCRYRTPTDRHSIGRQPLLRIQADRIVPLPLHLYLGINNRIIFSVFDELLGEERVAAAVQKVRSIHTPGSGGVSDLHTLNGPELRLWIKWQLNESLLREASASNTLAADVEAKLLMLTWWMETLESRLLTSKCWEESDLKEFRTFLDDIHMHWGDATGHRAFPKLHMLRHALEFAERYQFLGRVSEAQIESFHAQFNDLLNWQHRNMSQNQPERVRRSLADVALKNIQPFAAELPPVLHLAQRERLRRQINSLAA